MPEDTPARLLSAASRAICVSSRGHASRACTLRDAVEQPGHGHGVVPTVDHRRTLALNRVHAMLSRIGYVGYAMARATDFPRILAELSRSLAARTFGCST
jgi:hypothetical protein